MLRVFLCVSSRDADPEAQQKQVKSMLHELRINATIVTVPWDHITTLLSQVCKDLLLGYGATNRSDEQFTLFSI